MASPDVVASPLGRVLIDFSAAGRFPEEDALVSAGAEGIIFPEALGVIANAKSDLEAEIRQISHETSPSVDDWIANAKSIQEDIRRSRNLANSIVRQAEVDEERCEKLQEKELYASFLAKEVAYNQRLLTALRSLQEAHTCLVLAEQLIAWGRIDDALFTLEDAWKKYFAVPLDKSTRATRLLDSKCFDVRNRIHDQLFDLWNSLVQVDRAHKTISIHKAVPDESISLQQALLGLKSFKEVDKAAKKLWEDLDVIIIKPRTRIGFGPLPSIQVIDNTISLGTAAVDQTVKALFLDLEQAIRFLIQNLPPDVAKPLSQIMMPEISQRILGSWLDTAVPPSLDDMVDYQKALAQVNDFASKLDNFGWPGADSFHEWVGSASKIWLNKRRETAMDWTRNQLSLGVGAPLIAERVEKRMVARDEGRHIPNSGGPMTQEWDAAWDSDAENRDAPSLEETSVLLDDQGRHATASVSAHGVTDDPDDDAGDAWGWGDDDQVDSEPIEQQGQIPRIDPHALQLELDHDLVPAAREVTLSEKYWTSSMPRPLFSTVTGIYDDGARLTKPESAHIPVAPAANGLFSLPTLVLAMYRATSPYYYAYDPCGNMYLYNDSMWLSEQLKQFSSDWQKRTDLPARVYGMVKLDPEIVALESFGKRAYTAELNSQRTIINDLLGGAQNFFQQEGLVKGELENSIRSAISHIQDRASMWERILPYSAWASATGSMVNAVATKLINDVFDLTDIGVDEAERTATIISKVEDLDKLFLPKSGTSESNGAVDDERIPATFQFADKWMKMKFLSEVLQSNLKDVKFLWFESDLSLYFTSDEVIDLINLSFEKNAAVRQTIKEIREDSTPREREF